MRKLAQCLVVAALATLSPAALFASARPSAATVAKVHTLAEGLIANYQRLHDVRFAATTAIRVAKPALHGEKRAPGKVTFKTFYEFCARGGHYRVAFRSLFPPSGAGLDCTQVFNGRRFEFFYPATRSLTIFKKPPAKAANCAGLNPLLKPLIFMQTVSPVPMTASALGWYSLHYQHGRLMKSFLARFQRGGTFHPATRGHGALLTVSAGNANPSHTKTLYRVRFSLRRPSLVKSITICEPRTRPILTYTFTYRAFKVPGGQVFLPIHIAGKSAGAKPWHGAAVKYSIKIEHLRVDIPAALSEFSIDPRLANIVVDGDARSAMQVPRSAGGR